MPLRLVRDVRGSIHEYTVTLEPADGRSGWRAGAARGLLLLALVRWGRRQAAWQLPGSCAAALTLQHAVQVMASAAGAAVLGRLQVRQGWVAATRQLLPRTNLQ